MKLVFVRSDRIGEFCGGRIGVLGDRGVLMPVSRVDLYAAIRRDARAGMSGRAMERKHGVGRRTIIKALASAWPEPRKKPPRRIDEQILNLDRDPCAEPGSEADDAARRYSGAGTVLVHRKIRKPQSIWIREQVHPIAGVEQR